ncbi:MAG: type II toxin-antitoxin system HicA family toxin [Lentisphaerae bacterium]|nr:type II toxin-antitoxin system HicA family toxin [Lentisphaerota bacterium]
MSKYVKVFHHIMTRRSDSNVAFNDLCELLIRLGFDRRIRGDHHVFTMTGVEEIINLQPKHGMAKAYQVKQVREMLLKYKLRMEG